MKEGEGAGEGKGREQERAREEGGGEGKGKSTAQYRCHVRIQTYVNTTYAASATRYRPALLHANTRGITWREMTYT